ncbi:MAG: ABC transporter ATP-binding protein [Nannocystaceae bacterium]
MFRELEVCCGPGEVLAVVGPNGSGKTTLLQALLGLRAAEEGWVELGGDPLSACSRRSLSRRVAYLAQRPDYPHDMLVERVVLLGRVPHLPWFGGYREGDYRALDAALQQTQTDHLRHRGMKSLSGGELQRVMLARMLCTEADVLIFDEPTTALDIGHTFTILEQCRELADAGKVVVVSMHEVDLARRVADRVLCLHGDAIGTYSLGSAADVLTCELLGRVFDIDVAVRDGALVFGPGRLLR